VLGGADMTPTMLRQGRFMQFIIYKIISLLDVNVVTLAPLFGFAALFSHSLSCVSILWFLGARQIFPIVISATLMALHPYACEILTYRMSLPAYAFVMFCFSVVLLILQTPYSLKKFTAATALSLTAISTYQIIASYMALAIGLSLVTSLWPFGRGQHTDIRTRDGRYSNTVQISSVFILSLVLYVAISKSIYMFCSITPDPRSRFIGFSDISARWQEALETLKRIFWYHETIVPQWTKKVLSVVLVIPALSFRGATYGDSRLARVIAQYAKLIASITILFPLSLGVPLVVQGWWPNYRVVAQVGVLFSLVGVYLERFPDGRFASHLSKRITYLLCFGLIIQFYAINTSVFSEQRILNYWDRRVAQEITSQIRQHGDLNRVKRIYIDGGFWRYPKLLGTTYMDLNVSAWIAPWARIPLMNLISGSNFSEAKEQDLLVGHDYCAVVEPWPSTNSVAVVNDLAIICLSR
jgi:hypothetical protein